MKDHAVRRQDDSMAEKEKTVAIPASDKRNDALMDQVFQNVRISACIIQKPAKQHLRKTHTKLPQEVQADW